MTRAVGSVARRMLAALVCYGIWRLGAHLFGTPIDPGDDFLLWIISYVYAGDLWR